MRTRLILRRALLPVTVLLLVGLAWWALAGAIRQIPISHTAGRRIETAVQCMCGILTLLVVLTRFVLTEWAPPIRIAWATSLALTAGLSALVWGPPMPLIALLFAGVAVLVAWVLLWTLGTARAPSTAPSTVRDADSGSSA